MAEFAVDAVSVTDNTDGMSNIPGARETNEWRKLHLIISKNNGEGFRLKVQSRDNEFDVFEDWEDDIPLSKEKLWGAVQMCRQEWRATAVEFRENKRLLLQDKWDFAGQAGEKRLNEQLLPKLAIAGRRLFRQIFLPEKDTDRPNAHKRLRRIGEALCRASRRESMWIRITSDDFYAPWNMIYYDELTDPDGMDAKPEGFWGYRHLIEHVPVGSGNTFSFSTPFQISMQLDDNIDDELGVPCNAVVKNQFDTYDDNITKVLPRPFYKDLHGAIHKLEALQDHVLYFCCHAQGVGDDTNLRLDKSYLWLTDRKSDRTKKNRQITPEVFADWLHDLRFEHGPVVFLNACQTAQMNSIFYEGFVPAFLGHGASSLIGTQTEMPAIFAGKFAQRFFEEFFSGGIDEERRPLHRIGDVLLELRREFIDRHNNPLGLLFSLYRGADVFLEKPLAKKTGSSTI